MHERSVIDSGLPPVKRGYLFVHDPTMAKENGIYYLFSTGDPAGTIGNGNIQVRTSRDLRDWTYRGTVFADKPAWITSAPGASPTCGHRTSRISAACGICTTRVPASAPITR